MLYSVSRSLYRQSSLSLAPTWSSLYPADWRRSPRRLQTCVQWSRRARSKAFLISWHGIRDLLRNLRTRGFANSCGWPLGPFDHFGVDSLIARDRTTGLVRQAGFIAAVSRNIAASLVGLNDRMVGSGRIVGNPEVGISPSSETPREQWRRNLSVNVCGKLTSEADTAAAD